MGMFDYIKCKFPLPLEGANDLVYQTKDLPVLGLVNYEIHEDGTLWENEWEEKAKVGPFFCDFTGSIHFYSFLDKEKHEGWIEWKCEFVNGKMKNLKLYRYNGEYFYDYE